MPDPGVAVAQVGMADVTGRVQEEDVDVVAVLCEPEVPDPVVRQAQAHRASGANGLGGGMVDSSRRLGEYPSLAVASETSCISTCKDGCQNVLAGCDQLCSGSSRCYRFVTGIQAPESWGLMSVHPSPADLGQVLAGPGRAGRGPGRARPRRGARRDRLGVAPDQLRAGRPSGATASGPTVRGRAAPAGPTVRGRAAPAGPTVRGRAAPAGPTRPRRSRCRC